MIDSSLKKSLYPKKTLKPLSPLHSPLGGWGARGLPAGLGRGVVTKDPPPPPP